MWTTESAASLLLQTLERSLRLDANTAQAVERACGPVQAHRAGDPLPGDTASRAFLVLSGWAAEERDFSDGRRQILRLLVRGDLAGLRAGPPQTGAQVTALTDLVVADVTRVRHLVQDAHAETDLGLAWRRLIEAEDAAVLRHLLRLGRLSAFERTTQLLIELFERTTVAGLARGPVMPMPLTQKQLADHLGLSVVHANRVLQQLRRGGYVELRTRQIAFKNLAALAAMSWYRLGTCAAPATILDAVGAHA